MADGEAGNDRARVAERFAAGRDLVDDGLLKPDGRKMVRAKTATIERQTGRTSHIWARPLGEGVDGLDEVYERAGLRDAHDLVIVFDGRFWTARGWGLSPAEIRAALADGERGLERNWAHGLVAALIALDLAAHEAGGPRADPVPGLLGGLGLGVVLIGGAVGWTFLRQRQARQSSEGGSS